MIKLGVNIDHVATLRQARRVSYPDLLEAALAAERGGAEGITVHLREDRRHIQDDDVFRLQAGVATKLNLELAATQEMRDIALRLRPADACIVPERRQELTTEGGLDAAGNLEGMTQVVAPLQAAGIRVSLFVDPEEKQVEASLRLGAVAIEIHTGAYAAAADAASRSRELARITRVAEMAAKAGLIVNAGHGLTLTNVGPIAAIGPMNELNIGHSIVCDAIFIGLEEAVRRMLAAMRAARSE